ncbi:MAG: response regulator [Myxococcota bacterium]|nr:response regulator [Myxococcota bacterium]
MSLPKILIVDDEEAILETMTFTFMGEYEVLTTVDPRQALDLLDENAPVAVLITDQRMPHMTGVELLEAVYARHPETVRIMLTGFADSEATIQAINAGHAYAYISKPWEPEELKSVVRRAAELHVLSLENRRLLLDLQNANSIMQAVMDKLEVGAVAVDREGLVRAANAPARAYLQLEEDPRGRKIDDLLATSDSDHLVETVRKLADEHGGGFEEMDLEAGGCGRRVRISVQPLVDPQGLSLGRVVRFKEISHEPLRRIFEEIIDELMVETDGFRIRVENVLERLGALMVEVEASGVTSPNMAELAEVISRAQTAMQGWLDVEEALQREDYPDAQLLRDRMLLANKRWPRPSAFPDRIQLLARRVEDYYESGENPRERIL